MTKGIKAAAITFCVVWVVSYLIGAFIMADFNITQWRIGDRAAVAVIGTFLSAFLATVVGEAFSHEQG